MKDMAQWRIWYLAKGEGGASLVPHKSTVLPCGGATEKKSGKKRVSQNVNTLLVKRFESPQGPPIVVYKNIPCLRFHIIVNVDDHHMYAI